MLAMLSTIFKHFGICFYIGTIELCNSELLDAIQGVVFDIFTFKTAGNTQVSTL